MRNWFWKKKFQNNLAKRFFDRAFITFYYNLRKLLCQQTTAFHFSHHSHELIMLYDRPIFMLWLVKICQVRSCRKFIQNVETCLLWQSFFGQLVMFFLLSFSTGCIKWNTAAIISLLLFMAGLFIEFFDWEVRRLSKLEIRFRMTSFSFFTFLDAGWKVPQAILALLDSF